MKTSRSMTVQNDLELGLGMPLIIIGIIIAAKKMLSIKPDVANISRVKPILDPLDAIEKRRMIIIKSARFISKLYYYY